MSYIMSLGFGQWLLSSGGIAPELAEKLERFEKLQDGFAFGKGKAFEKAVLQQVKVLIEVGSGLGRFRAIDVFPGRHGNVVVSFYDQAAQYDYAVWPDAIKLSKEINGEDIDEERPMSLAEALKSLVELGTVPCRLYSFSSPMTMTRTKAGLEAKPLNPTKTGLVSPYSTKIAPSVPLVVYANTQTSTTARPYLPGPQSSTFGSSTSLQYQDSQHWLRPRTQRGIHATERSVH